MVGNATNISNEQRTLPVVQCPFLINLFVTYQTRQVQPPPLGCHFSKKFLFFNSTDLYFPVFSGIIIAPRADRRRRSCAGNRSVSGDTEHRTALSA